MKPSEVIREARALLFERGWYQGNLYGPDGSLCIEAACREPRGGALDTDAWAAVQRAVHEVSGSYGAPRFNDTPGRTFDEIVDVLDRAEKIALLTEESDA